MDKGLIVVAGMSRGGTNLLWNIVQSHPDVIDSYYELNEIFARKTGTSLLRKALIEFEALGGVPIPGVPRMVRKRLARFARKSFDEDRFNREKAPGAAYEAKALGSLTICTKLVSAWEVDPFRKLLKRNDALKYIPLIERAYPTVKVIFLVRNGLAMAEGWGRRGADVDTAAYWYKRYVRHYETFVQHNPERSMIVRFEDLLADPFAAATSVYRLLGLTVSETAPLRIAIKPTIRANRNVINTTEKTKVWIQRDNWAQHLDTSINDAQISGLPEASRNRFVTLNGDIMERYGYL